MITPSYGLTATERVLPRMALDFTTASLDSRITFTRALNTATRVNSSGFIETVNANLPRFDYDPTTLVCKGLLIEESRTNLIADSNNFSVWNPSAVTVTINNQTSPDGTQNADTLTATGADCAIYVNIPVVISQTYSYSVYLKAATTTSISMLVDTNAGGSFVSNPISVTTSWQRFSFQFVATGLTANIFIGGAATFSSPEVVYAYGAQVELGAFPTSYIPTSGATSIRNADVATMTGTNFSDWYTATTGAAVVWSIPQTATGVRPLIQFDDTTALKVITLRGNVADPELYIVNTTTQAQIDAGTIVANTAYKLSGGWNTNDCSAAKDGGTVGTDTSATIPAPTQLRIGSDGTNYACSWVQKIMYWKQRIINAEVQAFSK